MRHSVVTKKPPALVAPCEPTPTGYHPLSLLDRLPAMRSYVHMIHVFRSGREPARVIREALARALVPYYPVAGRFATSSGDGKLYVDCNAEGVWFVEARADCRLEDVGYLECQPLVIPNDQLFPSAPAGLDEDALTFMLQVTEFKCGGFVLGFKCSHCLFDAIGVGQFLLALSELARGLPRPTVKPVWCREAFPEPANFQHQIDQQLAAPAAAPPPPPAAFELEHFTTDISQDLVNRLKNSFLKETGKNCSVFDVLTALVWQCRTRAAGLPPDARLTLNFPANIRQELRKELPAEGGYYGNCVYHIVLEAASGKIAGAPLFDVVRLIGSAKERLSAKFARWLKGDPDEVPLPLSFSYGSMSFTDLRRVGFVRTDYGWGEPDHVVPIFDHPIAMCIFLNSPAPRKGVRLMTHCVVKEQLQAFKDEIKKLV
ncbi:uncharacterized protein M6B38_103965 [Iris pallida]|uniref:Uncharacterized protein n=1 Tax=Iris pallida TaxID=29817 RepID=A0AAX6F3C7_IRIPA|nr:uncharacterized protein M6B38_103965 [Iris pallida]